MLVKLTPEQCMAYWPSLRDGIIKGMPQFRVSDAGLVNMQKQFLIDDMQCWVYAEFNGQTTEIPKVINGILTTKVLHEPATEELCLCLYSLYSPDRLELETYRDAFAALKKFAISKDCSSIVAYTNVKRLKDVFSSLGGDTSWSICNYKLGE